MDTSKDRHTVKPASQEEETAAEEKEEVHMQPILGNRTI